MRQNIHLAQRWASVLTLGATLLASACGSDASPMPGGTPSQTSGATTTTTTMPTVSTGAAGGGAAGSGAAAVNGGPASPAKPAGTPSASQPASSTEFPGTATAAEGSFCSTIGVMRNRCQTCHGATRQFGAPMSLVTYDDLKKPAFSDPTKKVYQLVGTRIHDTAKPMPPSGNPTLQAGEIATIDAFVKADAPAPSDPTCGGAPAAPTENPAPATEVKWPDDCDAHYQMLSYSGSPGTKYTIQPGQEIHPQVMIAIPWKGEVQAVAFRPIVDNSKVLHHWILNGADGTFITGWAPGGQGNKTPLPADVGMYMPSSGQLRLDMHYNNLTGTAAEQDASGVEVCVISDKAKFRKNTATVVGIIGNANAPAHQHVDNATTCTVTASMGTATLIGNSPHMHLLGVHAKFELTQDGKQTVLHDDAFSFDDQHSWPLDPAVTVKTGDKFTVTCSYTNNTDKGATFGENTGNEMCFNFVTVYPKGGFSCR
jgi:hypothetical protein